MRLTLPVLFLLSLTTGAFLPSKAQKILEFFNAGDSAFKAQWKGNTAKFEVKNNQLQSTSTVTNDTFYVAKEAYVSSGAVQWSLSALFQFNTSSTNFIDWYLFADSFDLRRAQTCYYVRMGNTADEVSLYRRTPGKAPELLIDGRDGRLNRSTNPLYVRVEKTAEGKWFLWVATDANPASLELEGSFQDNGVDVRGHTGLLVRQSTSSFFGKHFFSYFYMGPPIVDTLPPSLVSCNLIQADSIHLLFSEPLLPSTTVDTNLVRSQPAWDLIGGGLSADRRGIQLKLKEPLENLTTYWINVIGAMDSLGNRAAAQTCSIQRISTERASVFDVIINEVMPTPTPAVGLPPHRYVELYNRSKKAIDLHQFVFSNRNAQSILPAAVLLPDSFLILCSTTGAPFLATYGRSIGVVSFPTFAKTSDVLTLRDREGNVIHAVAYEDSWYGSEAKKGGGFSLELSNPLTPCAGASHWRGSEDDAGGTPGKVNSVFSLDLADTVFPRMTQLRVVDTHVLELTFSEPMLPPSLLSHQQFQLKASGQQPHTVLEVERNKWLLYWKDAFQIGKDYVLYGNFLKDCAGNEKVLDSLYFAVPEKAVHLDVLITELMPAPLSGRGLPNAQFVELHNRSKKPIDLIGFKFSDRTAAVMLPAYVLYPDSFIILCHRNFADSFRQFGNVLALPSLPTLNKTSDDVQLFNKNGDLIHAVSYTDNGYGDVVKKQGGFSLEMKDLDNPCAGEKNWAASVAERGGTPGRANSVKGRVIDNKPPQLLSVYPLHDRMLELRYNEPLSHLAAIDKQKYVFSHPSLGMWETPYCSLHLVRLPLAEALQKGEMYQVFVRQQMDCAGNESSADSMWFGLAEPLQKGELLLTELLFHPPQGLSEFVELYNAGKNTLDLKEILIGNLQDDGRIRSVLQPFPHGHLLLPGKYIALSVSGEGLCQTYICKEPRQVVRVGSLPSYPQKSGGVVLLHFGGVVLDSFLYTSSQHHPLLKESRGVSLERVRTDYPAHWRDNWTSATSTAGFASPGYENSQAQQKRESKGEVSLQSLSLNPNNDGKDDRLALDFSFPQSGYVATLHVFNSDGIPIAKPFQQHILPMKGTLYWDLRIDTLGKEVLPPGIYILLLEAFHPEGDGVRRKMSFSVIR